MSEIHSLSGAYAVDALDDIERAQFERHLAECQACREEVASLREAAGMLAHTASSAPPSSLRDRVLADIATVRPLPPEVPTTRRADAAAVKKTSWSTRPGLLVAAAVAAIALGGTAAVTHPWSNEVPPPSAVAQVIHAPDAQHISSAVSAAPGARMTVYRSVSHRQAVMVTRGLPDAPAGKIYQAWFQEPNGQMVSAGLMGTANGAVLLNGDAATAIAAAITLEPAGGSAAPSEAPQALVRFSKA